MNQNFEEKKIGKTKTGLPFNLERVKMGVT